MNPEGAIAFLKCLFGHPDISVRGLMIVVWSTPSKRATFHPTPESAAEEAIRRCHLGEDVYFGLGLVSGPLSGGRRGRAEDVAAITCVWADVDVMSEGVEKTKPRPPTVEHALALIHETGVAPSVVVNSGHGLHAYWLLDEPLLITNADERQQATAVTTGWVRTIQGLARARGWAIDSVGDISRVLRVPGTVNLKHADRPLPVAIVYPGGGV